jgi:hypothetical protein
MNILLPLRALIIHPCIINHFTAKHRARARGKSTLTLFLTKCAISGVAAARVHVHDVALLSRTPLIMTFANAHSDDVIKRRASDEEGGGQVDFSSRAAAYTKRRRFSTPPLQAHF